MDVVTLISSVVGLATAVAALLAVLEMRRQRVTVYRPDLAVSSSPLFAYAGTLSLIGNSVHCSTTRHNLPSDAPDRLPKPSLDCFNLGLGAAKDVHIAWRFDVEATVRVLGALAEQHGMRVVDDGECGIALLDVPGLTRAKPRLEKAQMLAYVLPIQVQSSPQPIYIPSEYLKALAIYASYYVPPDSVQWSEFPPEARPVLHMFPSSDGGDLHPLPSASLSLTFRDIGDNTHVRVFHIAPSFFHIQQLPRERDQISEFGSGQLLVFPDKRGRTVRKAPVTVTIDRVFGAVDA
jgi:hypothetical protein